MSIFVKTGLMAAMMTFAANAALAHATLEVAEAPVGASYKAVLRISHGCGDLPTLRVLVRIPEGFIGAKPMPKAGWSLETKRGPYGRTYEAPHVRLSEGVQEITWSGGSLPGDWYDEFVFVGTIAAELLPGATLYFPTVQECGTGAERWDEIPADGAHAHRLKAPAPGVRLTPGGHHHH